jgi:predicted DNA-binding transcriptional regulator YafY
MLLGKAIKIVTEAIEKKLVIEMDYIKEEDGARTCRLMEPLDIAVGRRSKSTEKKFWGWCLYHDRIEQKTVCNIISIRLTEKHFDPKVREMTFKTIPQYEIPRNW